MHTFRRSWLALLGGILLLALSVSAAFGAKPSGAESNRGQTVATCVHDVVFGTRPTTTTAIGRAPIPRTPTLTRMREG